MAVIAPLATLAPPVRSPRPYGLFSVVTPTTPTDGHWQLSGAQMTSVCGQVGGRGQDRCYDEPPAEGEDPLEVIGLPKDLNLLSESTSDWKTFTVIATRTCTPGAGTTAQSLQDDAVAALILGEERRVEQALWTGDLGNTGMDDTPLQLGTALSPSQGLAALEEWTGDTLLGQGVIHITRRMAVELARKALLVISGTQARTVLGTPVVIGSGYPGSGPAGAAAAEGTSWAFSTGALVVARSEVFMGHVGSASFDSARNDLTAVAERTYLAAWDVCPDQGAAAVNITEEA